MSPRDPETGFPAPWRCPRQRPTPTGILNPPRFGPWPFSPAAAPGCQVAQSRSSLCWCRLLPAELQQQLGNSRIYRMRDRLPPPPSAPRCRWERWMVAASGNKRRKTLGEGGSPVCSQGAGNRLEFHPAQRRSLSLRLFVIFFFFFNPLKKHFAHGNKRGEITMLVPVNVKDSEAKGRRKSSGMGRCRLFLRGGVP